MSNDDHHDEVNKRIDATLARADSATASTCALEAKWKEFHDTFKRMNAAFISRLEMTVPMLGAGGGFGYGDEAAAAGEDAWHGHLGIASWPLPRCVLRSDAVARPGYATVDKSEYIDEPDVLDAKVTLLARMIKMVQAEGGGKTIIYAGAGISTGVGIPDYASSVSGASGVTEATKRNRMTREFLRECTPSRAHRVVAALVNTGLALGILSQNHDGLFQRSGVAPSRVNEIHGSCFDPKNPVVPMRGQLRPSNAAWMMNFVREAKLVICCGTSLSGMQSDGLVRAVSLRFCREEMEKKCQETVGAAAAASTTTTTTTTDKSKTRQQQQQQTQSSRTRRSPQPPLPPYSDARGLGSVIISLQKTQLDGVSSLRIFGRLDEVMLLLAKKLALDVSDEKMYEYEPFDYVPPSGEPIPDDRPDVMKSVKLARVTDRLNQQQKTEVLRKLTSLIKEKNEAHDGEVIIPPPPEAPPAAPAAAAKAAPASLSFVLPPSTSSSSSSSSAVPPRRSSLTKSSSTPSSVAAAGLSHTRRRSPVIVSAPKLTGKVSPPTAAIRRSPSSTNQLHKKQPVTTAAVGDKKQPVTTAAVGDKKQPVTTAAGEKKRSPSSRPSPPAKRCSSLPKKK